MSDTDDKRLILPASFDIHDLGAGHDSAQPRTTFKLTPGHYTVYITGDFHFVRDNHSDVVDITFVLMPNPTPPPADAAPPADDATG